MLEEIQRKFQSELDNFKIAQKEIQRVALTRQQLEGQLTENEIVRDELNILTSDAKVFKSVGPVLLKTDLTEAKQNVSKRIDYISKELKRVDELITSFEKKQDTHREALNKLQHQLQQAHVKAAMQA
ncbi:prefoldin subunit 6 [Coccinella septempunctata]|uniref:prefoldin subunit 6 n=1 Tax=Coccinella septempunctata TaxID=41139 RepID=UPI001D06671D|nr:prefoldin subunit 6 [Coccinella septempunctata]